MIESIAKWLLILILITSIISIPATGVWLVYQPGEVCLGENQIGNPGQVYIMYSIFTIMTVCGFSLRECSNNKLQKKHMTITCICTGVGLFGITIYIAVYTLIQSTVGFASLERQISQTERWMDIEQCLYKDKEVCAHLQHKYADDTGDQFINRNFTHIQSGCCKPPMECKFNFSCPTVWIEPSNSTYSNSDCYKWDNDPKKLCYNCQICKLGFAQDVKKAWTISGAIVVISMLMMPVLAILSIRVFSTEESGYDELR